MLPPHVQIAQTIDAEGLLQLAAAASTEEYVDQLTGFAHDLAVILNLPAKEAHDAATV